MRMKGLSMGFFDFLKKNKIDINEAVAALKDQEGAQLIDVREVEEYLEGRIPGSMNIPVQNIEMAAMAYQDKDIPIYVYCASGMRSRFAAAKLRNYGFTNVTDLGGINSYNGPLET